MARPLNDSPYLYGLHDPGGEHIMAGQKILGWILFTEALGSDPNNSQGGNYSRWANQGFGIIVRLNHGYEPNGTIPFSSRYGDFAKRCANFVRNSQGSHIWIIGNETNSPVERPGVQYDRSQNPPKLVQPGEAITPGLYANCYRQCRAAIKAVPGHANDQVITGAVAPWNPQTPYEGNPAGDWAQYLHDLLTILGPTNCDGISIHAYTHGPDPKLIYTNAFMNAPYQNRQYNFRTYQDFMNAIPRSMRSLPVYLTEADQNDAWHNENNGWIQRAYGEIDWWNRQPGNQKIRSVILYRWPRGLDKWGIEGKAGVIEDFKQAMKHGYRWDAISVVTPVEPSEPTQPSQPGDGSSEPTVDTSPIKFSETGRTASGPFAAFYRHYGLDITGYPLTETYVHPQSGLKTQDWQRVIMEEYPEGKVRLRLAGQELRELSQKVSRLERQIKRLMSGEGGPEEPTITDIIQQLPRKPEGFIKRPLDAIQHIVINHTAVRPAVGAKRVAQAQLARWPGIVSQYFITGDGQIQQTNPIDEVVTRDQDWIYHGINIYVAGNFDQTIPSDDQLNALAQLCAWLLYTYNLTEDDIKGVSEFIVTHSPGLQWQDGQRWKDILLERVRSVPSGPAPTDDKELAALHTQIKALQAQVLDLQTKITDAESRNAALQARLDELLKGSGGTPGQVTQPTITDITLQLPHDENSLKERPMDQVKYLVFNHTAVDPNVGVERVAAAHQRRWGAILYQYYITGDGKILQTNALNQVVDLNQPWIVQGINIAVAGNFTVEVPSDAQLQAAAQLSAWLMQKYAIPADNVKGVNEFIHTQSPGTQWLEGKQWKKLLLTRIAEVQQTAQPAPSPSDSAALVTLRAQVRQLETALSQAQARVAALTSERDKLLQQIKKPSASEAELKQQIQSLSRQVQALRTDKVALTRQVQALTNDKAALAQQVQALTGEKTTWAQQVQALTNDKAVLARQVQALTNDKAALAQQVQALTNEKTTLTQQVQALDKQVKDLLAQIKTLKESGGPSGPLLITPPVISDIVDKLPKHPTKKYATRTLDKITHIAIHHSAAPANVTPERVAAYHVSKDWPGIGYHFYIEPDGTIYQTNRLETISYQVYNNNHYSIGVCVSGTFNGVTPTPRQIAQAGHLVAWLMQKLNIKIENVWGHKEFPDNVTTCPGTDWLEGKTWKNMLLARIKAVQAGQAEIAVKTIGHYMLFWQRPDSWAKQDWQAAINYIARFRPTAGFSADDAENAEYVTIVGGVAGVSYETEQALVSAGCKVERLAGKDFADTKRMLDELAQSGHRFKTFDV